MFISLNNCRIYCLPDNYEVFDTSLNDIKYNLYPIYTKEILDKIDNEPFIARSLEGTEFYPGCLGMNNLKSTDFINVIL